MKKLMVLGVLSIVVLSSSCASIIQGTSQEISISSNPAGAMVTDNGQQLGKTPLVADLKRKQFHNLKIELEGYEPYEIKLSRKTSGWFWGNLLFGGIIGIIIDATNGAMYNLKPEEIKAELRKQGIQIDLSSDQMLIAITMIANPNWERIGELQKIPY